MLKMLLQRLIAAEHKATSEVLKSRSYKFIGTCAPLLMKICILNGNTGVAPDGCEDTGTKANLMESRSRSSRGS